MGFNPIVGYDFDGVLAVQPPDTGIPWRKMNGAQRKEKKDWLIRWYTNAPQLFIPNENEFVVITARKNTPEIFEISVNWLRQRLPGKSFNLEMLKESRNIENVVAFKSEVINRYGLKDYTEDNRVVVNALRKTVTTCRVWHFKNGRQILDYQAPQGF